MTFLAFGSSTHSVGVGQRLKLEQTNDYHVDLGDILWLILCNHCWSYNRDNRFFFALLLAPGRHSRMKISVSDYLWTQYLESCLSNVHAMAIKLGRWSGFNASIQKHHLCVSLWTNIFNSVNTNGWNWKWMRLIRTAHFSNPVPLNICYMLNIIQGNNRYRMCFEL